MICSTSSVSGAALGLRVGASMVGSGDGSSGAASMTVSVSSGSASGAEALTGSGAAGSSSLAQRFLTISQPYPPLRGV